MYTCTYIHADGFYIYIYIYICIHVCVCALCLPLSLSLSLSISLNIHVCMCIYIYIHTCMHVLYIYIYIHTSASIICTYSIVIRAHICVATYVSMFFVSVYGNRKASAMEGDSLISSFMDTRAPVQIVPQNKSSEIARDFMGSRKETTCTRKNVLRNIMYHTYNFKTIS